VETSFQFKYFGSLACICLQDRSVDSVETMFDDSEIPCLRLAEDVSALVVIQSDWRN
jgi:hypothetical protein